MNEFHDHEKLKGDIREMQDMCHKVEDEFHDELKRIIERDDLSLDDFEKITATQANISEIKKNLMTMSHMHKHMEHMHHEMHGTKPVGNPTAYHS